MTRWLVNTVAKLSLKSPGPGQTLGAEKETNSRQIVGIPVRRTPRHSRDSVRSIKHYTGISSLYLQSLKAAVSVSSAQTMIQKDFCPIKITCNIFLWAFRLLNLVGIFLEFVGFFLSQALFMFSCEVATQLLK